MGVLGGSQLVDFFEVSVYAFLNGVDRVFAWSFKAIKPEVSLGKCYECKSTDSTGVQSILLYSWLAGEAIALQVEGWYVTVIRRDALRFNAHGYYNRGYLHQPQDGQTTVETLTTLKGVSSPPINSFHVSPTPEREQFLLHLKT